MVPEEKLKAFIQMQRSWMKIYENRVKNNVNDYDKGYLSGIAEVCALLDSQIKLGFPEHESGNQIH